MFKALIGIMTLTAPFASFADAGHLGDFVCTNEQDGTTVAVSVGDPGEIFVYYEGVGETLDTRIPGCEATSPPGNIRLDCNGGSVEVALEIHLTSRPFGPRSGDPNWISLHYRPRRERNSRTILFSECELDAMNQDHLRSWAIQSL